MAQILAPSMQCQMKLSKGLTSSMTPSPWTSILLKQGQKGSMKCSTKFRVCSSLKSDSGTINRVEQLLNLDVSPYTDKIIAEYIWIGGTGIDLRSKSRTISKPVEHPSELPKWNYDGSSTGQAPGEDSEVILYPQAIFKDPFRGGNNILVICDTYTPAGEPIPTNKRHKAAEIFNNQKVVSEVPWFGIEQEYTLLQPNVNWPLGWPVGAYPGPQGPYYCGVGAEKSFGRDISDAHYKACLYAGINISGTNGEVMPGQWEFQVGPSVGIEAGDHVWCARYILERITEQIGVVLTLDPKPIEGDWNGAGCHTNYSTKTMREEGGYEVIKKAILNLSLRHGDHIVAYGEGNERRLTGKHETADINTFSWGVANRGCSIRVGRDTEKEGKGYLEDRRPASNMDPYVVTGLLAEQKLDKSTIDRILTFILGSAMKFPGYAKLKVLSLLKELGVSIMRVKDVESLLCDLLQRRYSYHFKLDKSHRELSGIDVDILCLLIEICSMPISSDIHIVEDHLLPALCIEGLLPDDAAIVRPCVAFLQKLNGNLYRSLSSETQQKLFQQLVLLYHDANNDVQNATREALLRLDVSASTVASILNIILVYEGDLVASPHRKKKSKKHNAGLFSGGRSALSSISSLLDVLLLKKDMGNRAVLIEPLFQLLRKAFTDKWVRAVTQEEWVPALSGIAQTTSNALSYIQQTVLLILEDIISSLSDDLSLNNGVFDKFDAALLVECAQSASDVVTSNHVYSLFATIAKVEPGKILHYIPAILAVISKSTVYHDDSHSKRVFEGLVSTVVPCWLSKMDGADNLLQIFINEMPGVAQHRRLSITLHLLKTLGESSSMGSLLVLLFRSLVSKERFSSLHNEIDTSGFINSVVQTEWEYNFAEQICEQYTCLIWLPSLVSLLKQLQGGVSDNNQCVTLLFALKFVSGKLQNPEVVMKLQSMEDMETIQKTLTELMVQVVFCWQFIDLSKKKTSLPIFLKKELKEIIHAVLMKITNGMLPSAFFQGVIRLLVQTDKGPRKKTLQVLCKSVRDLDAFKSKHERERNVHLRGSWNHLDGIDLDSFAALCLEILQLVDGSDNDLNVSVRLAAISALEILANKFPSNHAVFSKCLAIVVQNVLSDDLAVSSGCLRTAGALINVLGPRALPELPEIMKNVLQRTRAVSPSSGARKESAEDNNIQTSSKDTLMLAVLVTLEALVENLGAFLNPYLGDIVEIVLLHQDFVSESNQKIKSQADNVRRLVSEKVPVRLALPALQNVYTKAVKAGDLSLSTVFELLKNFVSKMDKSSVSGYHTNIFDLCMMALDLRSQHLASIKNINFVEKHVISAMIALTMKMTETMFKPLFLRSIEWVESSLAETNHMGPRNIGRAVSFYNLVNKLAENHRSLFVPYFKYLLEGFISFLSDNDDKASQSRKKKKAKIQNSESKKNEAVDSLSLEKWHLRALVLSSLHKCFLYDTGSVKFLDSTKFQLLLKPIVSQLIVEPPACIEDHPDIPSLEEADEILVSCVGQMAVTAGSDLLWKPLNYEVLMQTRSEMVRSRLLGLRIIKYLVENLKEEYLVLLAETIPFLAELLEDVELPVKTLAQEILKELESLSGENLQEYF